MNGWRTRDGAPADWRIEADGILTVKPGKGDIVSEFTYGDAHIHVEFREPDMPDSWGQGKGNSGVYVHGNYEIQVLDSYHKDEPAIDDCGSLYSLATALTNACKPALEWQTYDIILRAPRLENGSLAEKARLTVLHNGIVIHNNLILERNTPGGVNGDTIVERGPLLLQDHGNHVSFRNIWVMPLDEKIQ